MRATSVVIAGLTGLLAACDQSPVSPDRSTLPADTTSRSLFFRSAWTLVSLNFLPKAINDAGVVVGTQYGHAVRWQNGTLLVLPEISGLAGPYEATAISKNGLIAGDAQGHLLFWQSPSSTPLDLGGDNVSNQADAVGVDDEPAIGGHFWADVDRPFRWTPAAGIQYSQEGTGAYGAGVRSMNASGYMSGWLNTATGEVPARWSPDGTLTALQLGTAGDAQAINDKGDVAVNTYVQCPNEPTGYLCLSLPTLIWHANGTLEEPAGFPLHYIAGLSNAGRIIMSDVPQTWFNGVVTQLSYPDAIAPDLRGVNTCGSIIGERANAGEQGYLWQRYGSCDGSLLKLSASVGRRQ